VAVSIVDGSSGSALAHAATSSANIQRMKSSLRER
jgi:hypothetical protein